MRGNRNLLRALRRLSKRSTEPAGARAGIVRAVLEGTPPRVVAARNQCDVRTVRRWVNRVANEGLGGLADKPRSGRPVMTEAAQRARVSLTHRIPPNGTAWTVRDLASAVGVSVGQAHLWMRDSRLRRILRAPRRIVRASTATSPSSDLLGTWCTCDSAVIVFAVGHKQARIARAGRKRIDAALEVPPDALARTLRVVATQGSLRPTSDLAAFVDILRSRSANRDLVLVHGPSTEVPSVAKRIVLLEVPSVAGVVNLLHQWYALQDRDRWGVHAGVMLLDAACMCVLEDMTGETDLLSPPELRALLR
jgi:transposase